MKKYALRVSGFVCTVLLATAVTSAQDAATMEAPNLEAVAMESGVATFSQANAQINFVGEHEGPKPDPRKGGFRNFSGEIKAGSDGTIESINFEIKTGSLFTEIKKLTGHLKSPDFFDVRQHPSASFESTSIAAGAEGEMQVTGNLTLLGNTKEITIPAKVSMGADGVTLVSDFDFDRTMFGMTYGEGKVKKSVAMNVMIGAPTKR